MKKLRASAGLSSARAWAPALESIRRRYRENSPSSLPLRCVQVSGLAQVKLGLRAVDGQRPLDRGSLAALGAWFRGWPDLIHGLYNKHQPRHSVGAETVALMAVSAELHSGEKLPCNYSTRL